MKNIFFLFLAFILVACQSSQAAVSTQTSEVSEISEVSTPTSVPIPTIPPQFAALQEQIAQSGIYTLNAEGQIEMQTPDGMTIVSGILVSQDGTMTVTHEGEEFEADPTTIKIDGQVLTFQDKEGKTWVWDGKTLQEEIAEIREFVPANTIEFTETLSNYDLKLAPETDPKAIYWDIAVSHLGDATSKSAGMEANRAIYEAIITDHPEWEGISHSWDYAVRTEFMREFLTRSGGRMIVQNHNFEKFEADFNKPVKFEVIEVDELPKEYINMLALNRDPYSRGGGGRMYITENNQMVYSIAIVKGSLEHHQTYDLSFYKSWKWKPGEIISNTFRETIANTAYKNRDSDNHKYQLYTKGGVPNSGTFFRDVYWTFIK